MLALSALVRLSFVDAVGHMSAAVDPQRRRGVPARSRSLAGGLLALAATAACRALWRRAAAIAAAHRRARTLPGTGQVVVTEDAAADAYTIPGWPCRIVITQGMLDALAGAERDVLLAHERAHARNSHYLFTSAARLAAAANPLLRPVAAEVGYVDRALGRRARRGGNRRPGAHRPRRRPRRAGDRRLPAGPRRGGDRARPHHPGGRAPRYGKPARRKGRAPRPGPVPRRVAALLAPRRAGTRAVHAAARRGRRCWWPSPAPRPWRRPATCTSSSNSAQSQPR